MPIVGGEVPLRQRVGVGAVQLVVVRQLAEPRSDPLQGDLHPVGWNHLHVPLPAPRVHRGDHPVARLSVFPVGIQRKLRDRFGVTPFRAEDLPSPVGRRPPGLDLDDHLVAAEERQNAGRVGVPGHFQVRSDLEGNSLRGLRVGCDNVPARALHCAQHHRLKGCARLHYGQRLVGGRVRRFAFRRGVPQCAATAGCCGCPHHQGAVPVEIRRRAGVNSVTGRVLFVLFHCFVLLSNVRAGPSHETAPLACDLSVVRAAHAASFASVASTSSPDFRNPLSTCAMASPSPWTNTVVPSLSWLGHGCIS